MLKCTLVILVLLAFLHIAGCGVSVTLHPIYPHHIQSVKAGEPFTPVLDGFCVSKYYMETIMECKVTETR